MGGMVQTSVCPAGNAQPFQSALTSVNMLLCRGCYRDAAGNIRMGDIIISVGKKAIVQLEDLIAAVEQFSIGDQVPLGIRRGNDHLTVLVPLIKELPQAASQR